MIQEYRQLCLVVCDVAREAGNYIRGELSGLSSSDVITKGLHNYVTHVDTTAERKIVRALEELLPQAGFIVEENSIDKRGDDYQWIVDPLDGTTNFIHGIPVFSVSIALMHEGELVIGVVYEVMRDECFYAWKGGGAYLNEEPIRVSAAKSLSNSLLATGFPYYDYSLLDNYMELLRWCMRHTHGLRRIGSAAVDLVYVACGRFEGFFEYGLNAWDVAAGSLIVKEAGGNVSDFSRNDDFIFGQEILATNANIHNELAGVIHQHFAPKKT